MQGIEHVALILEQGSFRELVGYKIKRESQEQFLQGLEYQGKEFVLYLSRKWGAIDGF